MQSSSPKHTARIQVTDKMAEILKWKCGTCYKDLLLSPSMIVM